MLDPERCKEKYGNIFAGPIAQRDFERRWMALFVMAKYYPHFTCLPMRVYMNRDLYGPLCKALQNLVDAKLTKELKEWGGVFSVRVQRGSSDRPSLHSWGVAVDVNQSTNPLGATPTLSAEFVRCWEEAGFDWGGRWKRPDGMHFQLKEI